MKKLIIAAAVVAMSVAVQAASVDWTLSGGAKTDEGYTLYVFTSAISDKYNTFADFSAGAVDSASVVAKSQGPTKIYVINKRTATNDAITKSTDTLYYALIKDADATSYIYGSISTTVGGKSMIYDGTAQESSPGYLTITKSSMTNNGTIGGGGDVPEPTSAMLMLLGVAGLALRRKQK